MNMEDAAKEICEAMPQGVSLDSPAEILASLINKVDGMNLVLGENFFVGMEPSSPVDVTTFYDYGGEMQDSALAVDRAKVQVRVRSAKYRDGFQKCSEIKLALQSIKGFNYEEQFVVGVWVLTPPNMIARDENNNSIFTMNLKTIIQPNNKVHRQ